MLDHLRHICQTEDSILLKLAVFGIMDGKNKSSRIRMCGIDNIVHWCNIEINELTRDANDKEHCVVIIHNVVDNYEHWKLNKNISVLFMCCNYCMYMWRILKNSSICKGEFHPPHYLCVQLTFFIYLFISAQAEQ